MRLIGKKHDDTTASTDEMHSTLVR